MERESSKHGPAQDDQLKHEIEGMLRAKRPTRAQEGREVEPLSDDEEE